MLPPLNMSVPELAKAENIPYGTLYTWKQTYVDKKCKNTKNTSHSPIQWTAEKKLSAIIETSTLSEQECNEYCRTHGLYKAELESWKTHFIKGSEQNVTQEKTDRNVLKQLRSENKKLKKELNRKEKALAETVALLVLRKKLDGALGGKRGRLIPHSERVNYVTWINEAIGQGARKGKACDIVGISIRTLQNWQVNGGVEADRRSDAIRSSPNNKLSEYEQLAILMTCNEDEYANLPPSQIVPILADKGIYIASESSFYRVLHKAEQVTHRGRAKERKNTSKPTSYIAEKANQVWTWDISYMPTPIVGQFYYLYMIEDIYSRKIVGAEVYEQESGEDAATLLERSLLKEKMMYNPLVLHSDNGAPMKSLTLRSKMYDLNLTSSYSRPRVSNDNPYSEALFRTVKYCPDWPGSGFDSLDEAREWVGNFVEWYNNEHRHSKIKFVTPAEQHEGKDKNILEMRDKLYLQKKKEKPSRWSGSTRNWDATGPVSLNPDRTDEAA
ncbi:IS3 family transposase [Bathymodiolus japonicus methanotrophic gill symbiont]|uniref:IS3 family transposase n=2 Tax=Bathymodiolus japonicus methanotrophic gill symbiont TaxID=113269 RepID=UPI003B833B56